MRNNMQTYQDIFGLENWNAHVSGGFNSRVFGDTHSQMFQGPSRFERQQGWWLADEMIREGKIYFTHPFPHGSCKSKAFTYGGTWACNDCNRDHLDKPWWNVRVFKDGTSFCVVGQGFENLQESDNYAFGDTKEEALDNYFQTMKGF